MPPTLRILAIATLTSAAVAATSLGAEPRHPAQQPAAAPSVGSQGAPVEDDATHVTPATVDGLKSQPDQHVGQTVFLDGHVGDVFGPRFFTVTDQDFGASPALLVIVPERLAAGVRKGDHITLRGTVRRFDPSRFAGQWGWFPPDSATSQRLNGQIVVEASRIGGEQVLMLAPSTQAPTVGAREIPPSPTGTSGKPDLRTDVVLTDAARVATATEAAVGRSVELRNLAVSRLAVGGGFLANAGPGQMFVLPVSSTYAAAVGDHIDVQGVLLRMWPAMHPSIDPPARTNGDVYVLATKVAKR